MNKFPLFKFLLLLFSLITIVSCDKDYNEIGANIIGNDNFDFSKDSNSLVTCYNQYDAAVQSNNLSINMLGVNEDPNFGTTTASFVTQLELASIPTLKTIVDVQKVELTVPYFSTLVSTDAEGNSTYVLDSIYGAKNEKDVVIGKINLGVYESKKYLESYDEFLSQKKYFSDETSVFESNLGTTLLNDAESSSENSEFAFSPLQQTEIAVAEDGTETSTKVTPRMKLQLNKAFFKEKLFGTAASGKLVSNAIFKEYFRGIYFKVDAISGNNAMAALNFKNGKITIHYTEKADATSTTVTHKTMVLNMTGNTVNFYQNNYSNANVTLPTNQVPTLATTNLFLKGGSGFHSYIDLLGTANENGEVPTKDNLGNYLPEIKRIKDEKWIINEANLVFTSSSSSNFNDSPNRIYLYDAKNKRPLIDYYLDTYTNSSKPKYNKLTHNGIKYTENGLTKYKIRITNHLKNIINKDSTNVRLGLVVTEDINTITNLFIKNIGTDKYYNRIPTSSVTNPLGTILWGSDPSVEDSKRVKLEIFYTKPN